VALILRESLHPVAVAVDKKKQEIEFKKVIPATNSGKCIYHCTTVSGFPYCDWDGPAICH
jgi:hypothetical protein